MKYSREEKKLTVAYVVKNHSIFQDQKFSNSAQNGLQTPPAKR